MANYLVALDCMVDKSPLYQHITVDNDVLAEDIAYKMSCGTGLSEGNYELYREVAPVEPISRTLTGGRWIDLLNDSGFSRDEMQDLFCNHEEELYTSSEVVHMVARYEGALYGHDIMKLMEACYGLDF